MSIELTAAKCPCCGANIMLDNNLESGFCQYCGSKILVQAAIAFQRVVVEGTVKTKSADFIIKAGKLVSYNGEDIDVNVPENVRIIGKEAFKDCSGLKNIIIPDSVTTIEDSAFAGCSNLTSLEFPNSITSIGDCAFEGCSSLTSIEFPCSVTSTGSSAFMECDNLTSVIIPYGVTEISSDTFKYCDNLANIEIPNSVTTIDINAFEGCKSLTSIIIPDSVTRIGHFAFRDCVRLKKVTVPGGASYEYNTFSGCCNVTDVIFSVTSGKVFDADKKDLREFKKLERVICSDGRELSMPYYWYPSGSPLFEASREAYYKTKGLCIHCGGEFRLGRCRKCGRRKDY